MTTHLDSDVNGLHVKVFPVGVDGGYLQESFELRR
jgi:hypothetical protein